MTAIRADLCIKHHLAASEFRDCEVFMQRACQPGAPSFDAHTAAPRVPEAQCQQFILVSRTRIEQEVVDGPAPAPGAMPPPAAAPPENFDERGLTKADVEE